MWQLREALSRQKKARSDAKHRATEPLPRRWADLVLYLEEKERAERIESMKREAGNRS